MLELTLPMLLILFAAAPLKISIFGGSRGRFGPTVTFTNYVAIV